MSGKTFFACALGTVLFLAGTAAAQAPGGGGGRGGRGGPPGGPNGRGGRGGGTEQLAADLNLTSEQNAPAHAALRAYDEKMRQATLQARQELLDKMKDVLTADQFRDFKQELDRVPLVAQIPPGARGVPTDDLAARLLAFDKNKDGKITKDELPERMYALFDQGDTNKDGTLDAAEIKALAATASENTPRGGRGGFGGRGGQSAPGGRGPRGGGFGGPVNAPPPPPPVE